MDSPFGQAPSWLAPVCRPRPLSLGNPEVVMQERLRLKIDNKPALYYIQTLEGRETTGVGEKIVKVEDILGEICQHSGMVQPMNLDGFPPTDFSRFFPVDLGSRYYAQPFNYCAPFLSVAVLEPDIIIELYQAYSLWAKANMFSVLQFFLVTPDSWERYYIASHT